MRRPLLSLFTIAVLFGLLLQPERAAAQDGGNTIFLPSIFNRYNPLAGQQIVNAPYFSETDIINTHSSEMGIFWFGKVRPDSNYTDVRVAYNNEAIWVHTVTIDRRLWYNASANGTNLEEWDAVTLLLDLNGNSSAAHPTSQSYRFVTQLRWWEDEADYRAAFRGNGSQWVPGAIQYTNVSGWRGEVPNGDAVDDKGWSMTFKIPFASLGLSKPADGTIWRMAVQIHDRDSEAGPALPDQVWPDLLDASVPATWGRLRFGLPAYAPPSLANVQTTTIRRGLNGAVVKEASAGGAAVCGQGMNFWTEWGERNYAGLDYFNIQNQMDVSDWPCFSKYYVTFPLEAVPSGKVLQSAKLVLYQFGGSDPSQAWPSPIQVFTVGRDWDPATLNWNNGPQAMENIALTWVDVIRSGWQEVAYEWDVSLGAELALQKGAPLQLVVYSADSPMHSGKYFRSSYSNDWAGTVRPTLIVQWGDPR